MAFYAWILVTPFFTNVDVNTLHPAERLLVWFYPILSIGGIVLGWYEMTSNRRLVKLYQRDKHRERMSMKRVMEEDGLDFDMFLRRVDRGIDVRDDESTVL